MPGKKPAKPKSSERPRNSRKAIDKKFFAAIAKRNFKAAQAALDDGADINAPEDFGTVLIDALEHSRHDVIDWLLAQPAIDISQAGRYESPLKAALLGVARSRDAGPAEEARARRWVALLFERGVDAGWTNQFGQSALTRVLQFFSEDRAWLERTMQPAAVAAQGALLKWRPFQLALEFDAVIAYEMLLERSDKPPATPVVDAAKAGASKVLAWLLAHGHAIPGEALLTAKNRATAAVLIEAGAPLEARDKDGYSALWHACAVSDVELATLLLDRGASVAGAHGLGRPLAFVLSVPPSLAIAELLAARGADLTVRDRHGHSVADACREMQQVVAESKVAGVGREVDRMRSSLRGVASDLAAMLGWLEARGIT